MHGLLARIGSYFVPDLPKIRRMGVSGLKSIFAVLVLLMPVALLAADVSGAPSFEDYRKVGQVLQPYSRNADSGTYGVTLRVNSRTVKTLAEGRVYSAGKLRGYGRYVIIDHGHGWHSLYSNLARIDVQAGQQIHRGGSLGVPRHKKLFLVVSYKGNPINPSDVNSHRHRLISALQLDGAKRPQVARHQSVARASAA